VLLVFLTANFGSRQGSRTIARLAEESYQRISARSVKGGENVNVVMIRDLAHVVDREKARIGVFITLIEPTGPMKKEAVKAGFYETSFGKYP
jgi:hypothetical protein